MTFLFAHGIKGIHSLLKHSNYIFFVIKVSGSILMKSYVSAANTNNEIKLTTVPITLESILKNPQSNPISVCAN